jgi:hypothetical protein
MLLIAAGGNTQLLILIKINDVESAFSGNQLLQKFLNEISRLKQLKSICLIVNRRFFTANQGFEVPWKSTFGLEKQRRSNESNSMTKGSVPA